MMTDVTHLGLTSETHDKATIDSIREFKSTLQSKCRLEKKQVKLASTSLGVADPRTRQTMQMYPELLEEFASSLGVEDGEPVDGPAN